MRSNEHDASVITRVQAAKYLQISLRQLDRLLPSSGIPTLRLSERVVRFRRADLDAYLARLAGVDAAGRVC